MAGDEHEAGWELDRLIAEKVLGWSDLEWQDAQVQGLAGWYGKGPNGSHYMPWRFSTHIAHAFRVIEHLGHFLPWLCRVDADKGKWFCDFTQSMGEIMYADTPELAICRAALKAVECEEPVTR